MFDKVKNLFKIKYKLNQNKILIEKFYFNEHFLLGIDWEILNDVTCILLNKNLNMFVNSTLSKKIFRKNVFSLFSLKVEFYKTILFPFCKEKIVSELNYK